MEDNVKHMESFTFLKPLDFLENKDCKIALIQLNTPLSHGDSFSYFHLLWKCAVLKAVVDGGINRFYDHYVTCDSPDSPLPDVITGDFDSAKPEVLEYYRSKGVEIIATPDQDYTDFTKCLEIVIKKIEAANMKIDCIVTHVHFNGRLDHIFSLFHTLYLVNEKTSLPVYLFSGFSLARLLPKGKYKIDVRSPRKGKHCGLIPIGRSCDHVTTSGLKWNLNNQKLMFGELVSSSNAYDGSPYVTIENDEDLLWTMELNEQL